MKIALVFCPFKHKKFEEDLRVVSDEFGLYPPLGLAYIAAVLEKEGHELIIIDAKALKLTKEETLQQIKNFNPEMLGFMLTTYMFHDTLSWIKYLKKETSLPVMVGNVNMELYPKETMSYKEIDYGIVGPGQFSVPELIKRLENKKDISDIPGLAYKVNGELKINPQKIWIEDFTKLPHPSRHLLPNDKYYQFISKRKNFTLVITSKGCPYQCEFCAVNHIPYTERPLDDVLREIEECYYKFKVREIDFFEPIFTCNRKRLIKLCNALIKRKLDLQWSCRARVDHVDDILLRKMYKAGCRRIYYGIESGDQDVLDTERKDISLEQTEKAIKLTRKNKIKSLGFVMVGQQDETMESVDKTIKFLKKIKMDYIQVGRTIAKPGTTLHKKVVKEQGNDFWKDYVLGNVPEQRSPTPYTGMSEEEKFTAAKKMYSHHYMRPSYILSTLFEIRSKHELMRYVKAGLKFLFGNQRIDFNKDKGDL
jgi:anaerobic magnesium-protoporphyrin IX monomethyl ester cyclase